MQAMRIHKADSGVDGLVLEDAPYPRLSENDVIVKVHAAGFTPGELSWPGTWTDRAGRDRTPTIPGHEVSGEVVELGLGTTGLTVGQRVFGLTDWTRDGKLAQYVAVEARNRSPWENPVAVPAGQLVAGGAPGDAQRDPAKPVNGGGAPLPASIDHVNGAALPMAGLTAWQALCVHGRLEIGQTVMIHGAAGGVGSLAVQLAREAGARVIGTGRAVDRQTVLDLGADAFLDLENEPLEGAVDLVFDVIGGEVLDRSAALVSPGGTLVTIAAPPKVRPENGRAIFFIVEPDRDQLAALARKVADGRLKPVVGSIRLLAETREAFQSKVRTPGKTIIQVS